MASAVGILTEFDPKITDWSVHIGRVEQYFVANDITDDVRKRAILLNGLSQVEQYFVANDITDDVRKRAILLNGLSQAARVGSNPIFVATVMFGSLRVEHN
ncbi:hypothetical protein QE152_g22624 [Popillia japonica]|uniref:Uncharacterized protein n=1 Tax=Popillia japonica TaxID=7064 RepID=A0AAW1KKY6_POPJA